jgi:GTP-binding protein
MIFSNWAVNKVIAAQLQTLTRCETIARRTSCLASLTSNAFAYSSSQSHVASVRLSSTYSIIHRFTPRSATSSVNHCPRYSSRQHEYALKSDSIAPFSSAAAEIEQDDVTNARYTIKRRNGIRNVAIVAHVDHGKTTLVDELLKVAAASSLTKTADNNNSSSTADANGSALDLNRLMDSGELEKERGITITSKVTRLDYRTDDTSYIINVVDTPGHADFAGEVDRILTTVDGVVLVVDAGEGPKSQTKYVLSRALSLKLKPIVVLNKADRLESLGRLESGQTELELMDLFEALGADENQMEYRTLYGSARGGWITEDVDVALKIANDGGVDKDGVTSNMRGLFDAILEDIPAPSVHWYGGDTSEEKDAIDFGEEPFSLTATTVGMDNYLGRLCTGRIYSGAIKVGATVTLLRRRQSGDSDIEPINNSNGPSSSVTGLFANRGVSRVALDPPIAYAGDIVTLTGIPETIKVGDTLTSTGYQVPNAIDTPPLAPPTLSCLIGANNGPLAGKEGTIVASSRIRARLINETDNNVTLTVEKCESDAEKTVVFGRGELQIGILVEQMRREGYEMIITPPQILTSTCPNTGNKLEPYEEVVVDVDSEYSGTVVNALTGARKGVLVEMTDDAQGKARLKFEIPSRGLLGFGPEIATATRGTAVMHHMYLEDREYAGLIGQGSDRGKLVCNEMGKATLFALESLQARGTLFVAPGDMVYPGMVVGENAKSGDLEVNPVRAKATSNMRTQSKDEKLYLTPPKKMSIEELIGYMSEDEVIEVTPQSVRLRKLELDAGVRERAARTKKKQLDALKASGKK